MSRKNIWITNGQVFSKFEEFDQQTDPGNSMTPKQDENKENHTKAIMLKLWGEKALKRTLKNKIT